MKSVRAHIAGCERCAAWVVDAEANDDVLDSVRIVLVEEARSPRGHSPGPAWKARIDAQADASLPHAIEGFEILEEIGRGGMGVVYKAVQVSTKREVALKILLEGPFASEKSKRRFEREVELAAQLQHPHIVTILESGVASGQYYFAMQYVDGRHLDAYLADRKLSIDDSLRLFGKICDAITYAHQRGVIHRDLKPSNILVDKEGVPYVLDFGLAKVADPEEAAPTQLSITGQVMGTLPYMSPEQATGSHQDIDVRTDVYSLGVILYEMLTGKYPYPVVGHVAEVLKNIAEAEPEKPSKIRRRINDEVETIVLKALAKETYRRYQSVAALGSDIGRYLKGQPIEAKRDSRWYVVRKTLQKYKVPVTALFGFVVLLAASLVVTGAYYFKGERAMRIALQRENEKDKALDRFRNIATFTKGVFAAIHRTISDELIIRQIRKHLTAEADDALSDLTGHPQAEAVLRHAIGMTYRAIGEPVAALEHLKKEFAICKATFGETNESTLYSMDGLAKVYADLERYDDSVEMYEAVIHGKRATLGEQHPSTVISMNELAKLYHIGEAERASEWRSQLPSALDEK